MSLARSDRRKYSVLLFWGFFLLNIGLKIPYLASNHIAWDEPFTIWHAQKSLSEIFTMLWQENNPPLHFLLMHFWEQLFGISAWSVRMPSLIFSAFTAALLFRSGNRFFSLRTGILAASIFSLSTMHVYFAHEARVYSLFCMLTAGALYSFLSFQLDSKNPRAFLGLIIWNTLLIYSHYFGFFVLFAQLASMLISKYNIVHWKRILLIWAVTAVLYVPQLLIFWHRMSYSLTEGTWVQEPGAGELYGYINLFLNNRIVTAGIILMASVIIVIQIVKKTFRGNAALYLRKKENRSLLIWFLLPYLGMFLLSFKAPMFIDRYILFTSLPLFILIAYFFSRFTRPGWEYVVILVIIAGLQIPFFKMNPSNERELGTVVEKIMDLKEDKMLLFICPDHAERGFAYHYDQHVFADTKNMHQRLHDDKIFPLNTKEQAQPILEGYEGTFYYLQAGSQFVDPEDYLLQYFKTVSVAHQKEQISGIYTIHTFIIEKSH